jgi:hypothetical protein
MMSEAKKMQENKEEQRLKQNCLEEIQIGAGFLFGNTLLLVNNLPICCFPQ